ncbi:hypothetical protein Tco_0924977 [Tanacetum coccineum]|uniref:Uncharacterized protein n=1 Tax=Tanacetum coccineum TaxID=301880 RepID=A0ABQ5D8C2_9ASTR
MSSMESRTYQDTACNKRSSMTMNTAVHLSVQKALPETLSAERVLKCCYWNVFLTDQIKSSFSSMEYRFLIVNLFSSRASFFRCDLLLQFKNKSLLIVGALYKQQSCDPYLPHFTALPVIPLLLLVLDFRTNPRCYLIKAWVMAPHLALLCWLRRGHITTYVCDNPECFDPPSPAPAPQFWDHKQASSWNEVCISINVSPF